MRLRNHLDRERRFVQARVAEADGRRIVNEAKSGKEEVFTYGLSVHQNPRQRLASELNIPSPLDPVPLPKFDPAIEAEDRDPKLVLPNVAKQTSLTFTTEKRKVRYCSSKRATIDGGAEQGSQPCGRRLRAMCSVPVQCVMGELRNESTVPLACPRSLAAFACVAQWTNRHPCFGIRRRTSSSFPGRVCNT